AARAGRQARDEPLAEARLDAGLLEEEVEQEVARAGDRRAEDVAPEGRLREGEGLPPHLAQALVGRPGEVAPPERGDALGEAREEELEALAGGDARGDEERDLAEGPAVELRNAELNLDFAFAEDQSVEDILRGARHLPEPFPEVIGVEVR